MVKCVLLRVLFLCTIVFSTLECLAETPRQAQANAYYTEHALNSFTTTSSRGELLNLSALELAYQQSVIQKQPLSSRQILAQLESGNKQLRLLNQICETAERHVPPDESTIRTLGNLSPFLAQAAVQLSSASLLSPYSGLLSLSGPTVAPTSVNDYYRSIINSSLSLASGSQTFAKALDSYYFGILKVRVSSTASEIVQADSTSTIPNLSAPAPHVAAIMAWLNTQANLVQSDADFENSLKTFISAQAISTPNLQATQLQQIAAAPTKDQASTEYKTFVADIQDAKDLASISGTLLYFVGDPDGQTVIRDITDVIGISADIGALIADPTVSAATVSANMLTNLKDLLGGSSANQTTQQLNAIVKQLTALQQAVNNGFTSVNQTLATIYVALQTKFSQVLASQARIEDALAAVQSQIGVLGRDVSFVDIDLSAKIKALAAELQDNTIETCLNYRFTPTPMSKDLFNSCAANFVTGSTTTATDDIHAAGTFADHITTGKGLLSTDLVDDVQANLIDPYSHLTLVTRINNLLTMGDSANPIDPIASIPDWMTSSISYHALLQNNLYLLASSDPSKIVNDINSILNEGTSIQDAARSLTTLRDTQNNSGFINAISSYQTAIQDALDAVDTIEVTYRKKCGINTDLTMLDLWNSPVQDTLFMPPSQTVTPYGGYTLSISSPILHKALTPLIRNLSQMNLLPLQYTANINSFPPGNPLHTLPEFVLSASGNHAALPTGSTTTSFNTGGNYQLNPTYSSTLAYYSAAIPYATAPSVNAQMSVYDSFLASNWTGGADIADQALNNGWTSGGMGIGIWTGNFQAFNGRPDLAILFSEFVTDTGQLEALDFAEQAMDYHRDQVAAAVVSALQDPGSDLSKKLAVIDNAKDVLRDLVVIGLSDSAATDSVLQASLDGPASILDGTSVKVLLLDAFTDVTKQRKQELDAAVSHAWSSTEAFEVNQWMAMPFPYLSQRIQTANQNPADIATVRAFVADLETLPPLANNARTYIRSRLTANTQVANSLQGEISNVIASAPSGQPLVMVDSVSASLELDKIIVDIPVGIDSAQESWWTRFVGWLHRIF